MTKDNSPFGPLDTDAARAQEARLQKLARETMPDLPKRFYEAVGVHEGAAASDAEAVTAGFQITLDGRPVRTPAKKVFGVPTKALAEAVAAEWSAQVTVIDPRTMPLTRLANVVVDGVLENPGPLREEIANYAGNDLVCYRADSPSALVALQDKHWEPAIAWAVRDLGARPVLATGIMPVAQPPELVDGVAERILGLSPFKLAAVHVITTMTGSALFAAMLAEDAIGAEAVWAATHVDEDWQVSQWGEDAEAQARRAKRRIEFDAACAVLDLG